jgi:hypothetical protein
LKIENGEWRIENGKLENGEWEINSSDGFLG